MTKTFTASVKSWSDRAKRNCRLVIMEASESVYNAMTERQAGVKETGGTFVVGKVPVDTGALIGSAQVGLNGAAVKGTKGAPPDFMGVVGSLKLGDTIEAAFTAEYARHVEYGTAKMPGRFFVRGAVAQWPAFVARAAARYKD